MTKILVIGAAGRMGKTIVSCLRQTEGACAGGGTEIPGHPDLGRDIGELAGGGKAGAILCARLEDALPGCDVVIDFSTPESTMETLKAVVRHDKAIVIGTTGFSPAQKKEIQAAAQRVRCVLAPNMSIGVNVLFKMVREMAKALGDAYDVEIVEAHHRFKKDAPSGTAVRISEIVADALGRDLSTAGVYGRKGITPGRDPREIGIHTVRAGDIVGDHRVFFGGIGETVEIAHRAQGRETFARGAITAALWVATRPPGFYDMQDVLGLR